MFKAGLTLAQVCGSRDNNFKLLRFGAALAVFISHCPAIAGMEVVSLTTLLGYVAVNSFFVISGYLVAKSLHRRLQLRSYFWSRALRIYPALLLAVVYTVLIGLVFSSLSAPAYLGDAQTIAYLLSNMTQLFWPIPTTLPGLDWTEVNAPLWTLPFELHMYLLLALVAGLITLAGEKAAKWVWGLYFLAVMVSFLLYVADYSWALDGYGLGHYRYYLRFLAMFGSGVALYMLRDRIRLNTAYFLLVLSLVVLSSPLRPVFVLLAYGSLGYVLLYLAYVPAGWLRYFNCLGDYSYGIYIFGYPTQKAVMSLLPTINAYQLFIISFGLTLIMSILSWHWLESTALRFKRSQ